MPLLNTTLTVTEPSSIVAAENPIVVNIQTGDNGSPSFSESFIWILDYPTDGLKLTFNLTSPSPYTKTFTAKDYPVKDSYYFTDHIEDSLGATVTTGLTLSQIAGSLAEAIQNDMFISKYYHVNYTGDTKVYLKAKEASSIFNLYNKISVDNGAITNVVLVSSGHSQYEGSTVQDYSLYTEIFESTSDEYGDVLAIGNRIAEPLVCAFSQDNQHRFDFSTVAKSFLSSSRPDFNLSGGTFVPNYIKPFIVKYGEQYPLVINTTTKRKFQKGLTDFFYVTNSSIDYTLPNNVEYITGNTLGTRIIEVPFLTNSPSIKRSNRNEKELLYFIVPKNLNKSLKAYADISFWDGTSSGGTYLFDILNATTNTGGVYCMNVSFEEAGLADIETSTGKKIKIVTIYVESDVLQNQLLLNNSFQYDITTNWQQFETTGKAPWYYSAGSAAANFLDQPTSNNLPAFPGTWTGTSWTIDSTPSVSIPTVTNTTLGYVGLTGFTTGNYSFNWRFTVTATGIATANISFFNGVTNVGNASSGNLSGAGTFSGTFNVTLTGTPNRVALDVANFGASTKVFEVIYLTGSSTPHFINETGKLTQYINLDPINYNLDYDITFGSGTGNSLKFVTRNLTGGTLSSQYVYSGTSGNHTGTFEFDGTDVGDVQFILKGQSGNTQTAKINSVGISASESSPLSYTVDKVYSYPNIDLDSFNVSFLNKRGTFDTYNFLGAVSSTFDRSAKSYTVPININDDGSVDAGFKSNAAYDVKVTRKVTANSGVLNAVDFAWLKELIESNEIYEVSNDYVNYLKIDSVKYETSNQDNQYAFEITFIQTIAENNVGV